MPSIEERLAALEAEVQELREKVTDTHTLAAHADRDVAEFRDELRAQTRLLNLTRQDVRDGLDATREEMRSGFAEMRAGFEAIGRLLQQPGDQS